MKKCIISLLLAIVMMAGMLPTTVFATEGPADTVIINLRLRAVDADGGVIEGDLDALLNNNEWVGTDDLAYVAANCLIGENLLSNWDYCPDGYEKPDYGITFTCDENGNLAVTSGNAEVVVLDDITYIVVTLVEGSSFDDTEDPDGEAPADTVCAR